MVMEIESGRSRMRRHKVFPLPVLAVIIQSLRPFRIASEVWSCKTRGTIVKRVKMNTICRAYVLSSSASVAR